MPVPVLLAARLPYPDLSLLAQWRGTADGPAALARLIRRARELAGRPVEITAYLGAAQLYACDVYPGDNRAAINAACERGWASARRIGA